MRHLTKHISISINKPADMVYEFVSDPLNLPVWASGLSNSIRKENEDWIAESPMGQVKIHFAERNIYGILDHWVTLPTGETFYNPMRVLKDGDGSEVIFALFQTPGMSERQFNADAEFVGKDLEKLKEILEQ